MCGDAGRLRSCSSDCGVSQPGMFGSFHIDHVSTRGSTGPVFGGFGVLGLGSGVWEAHVAGGSGKLGVGGHGPSTAAELWRAASSAKLPEYLVPTAFTK